MDFTLPSCVPHTPIETKFLDHFTTKAEFLNYVSSCYIIFYLSIYDFAMLDFVFPGAISLYIC